MDTFGGYFEANTFWSASVSGEKTESSTLSDAGTSARQPTYSDEEVILASSRPKKRAGRKVFKETRHPVYRGIRRRNKNKWVCEVRKPNDKTRLWLGTYPNPEMAARAHDVAVLALRGRSACLNFADSAWSLSIPATTDSNEIRRAAVQAAEEFRTSQFVEDCGESVKSCEEVSDRCGRVDQELTDTPESVSYVDEEALLDMPGLLANMAEGLLLSPPHCVDDAVNWDDIENNNGVSLWSFSI